jgi:hypothetical protein
MKIIIDSITTSIDTMVQSIHKVLDVNWDFCSICGTQNDDNLILKHNES